ncbi:Na+ dependent nucleoside transporter C-terminus-domain-containing protein [Pisolithus marmoratus]|nr:Na+ dependent nucleoside transporter C-terminus-domain-containing protein [Pisolithus marmoratus]
MAESTLAVGTEFPADPILTQKRPLISDEKQVLTDLEKIPANEGSPKQPSLHKKIWVTFLLATAALILGWWISATVLKTTRPRWVQQTVFAWMFLLVIAFRFIPNSAVTRPIETVWVPVVQVPWYRIPRKLRLAIGWSCLLAITFGSAFGSPPSHDNDYRHRAISVLGLFVFQCGFYVSSTRRLEICWPTVITGLFIQQAIALFVLKTSAGYSLFRYIGNLTVGFLAQASVGAAFFFDAATIAKHWFIITASSQVIFFIATVQMLYYLGVMQWIIKGFAWFFFKLMNVSGAEAIVAAACPWMGPTESACLVKPYIGVMTTSELHLCMTSAFSIAPAGVLASIIALGVPPQNLITASVMSIPASIAISKMRIPETEEPVTRGRVVIDCGGEGSEDHSVNALHAFSKGGLLGLKVAGHILTNVLIILSFVSTLNAVLTWVGRGFGIHKLTLQLILGYIAYPIAFLLGVPSHEIFPVAQLIGTKLIATEVIAFTELATIQASSNPLSPRAFTIASYALCGFAHLSAVGIQIGVLSALAPSQAKVIARMAISAMICGFISTLQTATIAIVVLNKPPGLICQGSSTNGDKPRDTDKFNDLLHDLKNHFNLDNVPYTVHRLDKSTTGALVLAKNIAMARELARQFQGRAVGKTYLALVRGGEKSFPAKCGEIKDAIEINSDGRVSIDWELVASSVGHSSLFFMRAHSRGLHQLRVHLAQSLHTPILGDTIYSRKPISEKITEVIRVPEHRVFLHASRLTLSASFPDQLTIFPQLLIQFIIPVQQFKKVGTNKHIRRGIAVALPTDFVTICDDAGIQLDPMTVSGGLFVDDEPSGGYEIGDVEGKWMRPRRDMPLTNGWT